MQCPYYVHKAMMRALGLDGDRTVIVQAETGGGFGGKEEYPSMLAIHAALLARKAGRPVRMVYDRARGHRRDDQAASVARPPPDGRDQRTGGSWPRTSTSCSTPARTPTLSPVVLSRGGIHAAGPYACPNIADPRPGRLTNTPPNGAFRGFGAPQAAFAVETHLDRIAEALGISPLEIRRRNAYRLGDVTATGQVLRESVGALEALEAAAQASGFDRVRRNHDERRAARSQPSAAPAAGAGERSASGIGIALAWHGAGFTGSGEARLGSIASVEIDSSGRIRALAGTTEMGQGSRTVLAQLVAEALGVDPDEVDMAPQDTSQVPDSGPTVASRTTMVVGGLLATAAGHLRADVEAATGRAFAASYAAFSLEHGPLRATEQFHGFPGIEWDDDAYRGDAYPAYSWACAVAAVDVDLDTGEVRVRSVVQAADAGRIVNRVLAEGQVEGGTLQAVGWATIEQVLVEGGRYRNDRLSTYLIPTALDAPRIETVFVGQPFGGVSHGAKGLGELPMDVPAPAVIAAIHDATGVWITDLPATPEKILAGLVNPGNEVSR